MASHARLRRSANGIVTDRLPISFNMPVLLDTIVDLTRIHQIISTKPNPPTHEVPALAKTSEHPALGAFVRRLRINPHTGSACSLDGRVHALRWGIPRERGGRCWNRHGVRRDRRGGVGYGRRSGGGRRWVEQWLRAGRSECEGGGALLVLARLAFPLCLIGHRASRVRALLDLFRSGQGYL